MLGVASRCCLCLPHYFLCCLYYMYIAILLPGWWSLPCPHLLQSIASSKAFSRPRSLLFPSFPFPISISSFPFLISFVPGFVTTPIAEYRVDLQCLHKLIKLKWMINSRVPPYCSLPTHSLHNVTRLSSWPPPLCIKTTELHTPGNGLLVIPLLLHVSHWWGHWLPPFPKCMAEVASIPPFQLL